MLWRRSARRWFAALLFCLLCLSTFLYLMTSSTTYSLSEYALDSTLFVNYDSTNRRSFISTRDFSPMNDVTTDTRSKTAIFVLLDSTAYRTSVNTGTVEQGSEIISALNECKRMKSSLRCLVYFVLYHDDEILTQEETLNSILLYFLKLTIGNVTSGLDNDTRMFVRILSNRARDARLISDVVKEAYIANAEYFYFIPPQRVDFTSDYPRRKSIRELKSILDRSLPTGKLGVVVQTRDGSGAVVGLLCSWIHLEVFGEMFPYDLATLTPAIANLIYVYLAHNLKRSVSNGVLLEVEHPDVRADLSFGVVSRSPDVVRQERETLERYLNATRTRRCLRCNLTTSHNIIAMSLYGSDPRYTHGAIRNAQLFPVTFPKWRLWFYTELVSNTVKSKYEKVSPEIIYKLKQLGAEIRYVNPSETGLAPMLWRFTVAEDPDVDAFIVRDADSRLTPRDFAVVSDWLWTKKAFHCVRDHPSHSNYPVSGGLWGGRRGPLNDVFNGQLKHVMKKYGSDYIEDMNFLTQEVWPMVKDNHAYCHDSFSCDLFSSSHRFPIRREGYEHLGQVYDRHSIGRKQDIAILSSANVNVNCTPT